MAGVRLWAIGCSIEETCESGSAAGQDVFTGFYRFLFEL